MAPRVKVTGETVVNAAVEVVRECGAQALNARALAARLGCSTQPIFSNFASMEELRRAVDELEMNTQRSFWPMPSYGDILFSVN